MTADQAPPVWAEFAETAGAFFREDPIKTIRWIAASVPRPVDPRDPVGEALAPFAAMLIAEGCPADSPLSALRYLEGRPGTVEEFASWAMTLPPVIRVDIADDFSQTWYYWDNIEEGAPYWLTGAEAAAFVRKRGEDHRRAIAMFAAAFAEAAEGTGMTITPISADAKRALCEREAGPGGAA